VFVADSSVWIDFFRDVSTREVELLDGAVRKERGVLLCGPVMQEVLQGIRNEREYVDTRLMLSGFRFLHVTRWTFYRAAAVYRGLRKRGITLGPFDVLIGTLCLEYGVPLLTCDRKAFEPMARHARLELA